MIFDIEQYCGNSDCFHSEPIPKEKTFLQDLQVPSNWSAVSDYQWSYLKPSESEHFPTHGWKIHISAHLNDCENVILLVSKVCFRLGIPFKFCVDYSVYYSLIKKYADRTSSGKLLTIYPEYEYFSVLCDQLEDILKGTDGPEILTDLRISSKAPIFTRYGAFIELREKQDGVDVLGYISDNNVFVEDSRNLYFEMPSSNIVTTIPPRVVKAYELRQNKTLDTNAFPYEMIEALHFSNSGGVYKVKDLRDDKLYVLKESRKYVGQENLKTYWDSRKRLINQYRVTKLLETVKAVVPAIDLFEVDDHLFFKTPFQEGMTIWQWRSANFPYHDEDHSDYAQKTYNIMASLKDIVDAVHSQGYSLGDLNPSNIIIDEFHELHVIDLEACIPINTSYEVSFGTPGYMPPISNGMNWEYHDYYAFMNIILSLYLPMNMALTLTNNLIDWGLQYVKNIFGKKNYLFIKKIYNIFFDKYPEQKMRGWGIDGLIRVYDNSTSFEKCLLTMESSVFSLGEIRKNNNEKTIYPGSAESFKEKGKWNIYNGIAGVGLSLGRYNEQINMLCLETLNNNFDHINLIDDPSLLHGLTGVAAFFIENNCYEKAATLLEIAYRKYLSTPTNLSLGDGISGLVLVLLSYLRIDKNSTDKYNYWIEECLSLILTQINESHMAKNRLTNRGGFFFGACGVAVTLHIVSKLLNKDYSSLVQRCLLIELESYIDTKAGLQYDDGKRTLPYLANGSGGLIIASHLIGVENLPLQVLEALPKIEPSVSFHSCALGGLFDGAAGILLCENYFERLNRQEIRNYLEIPLILQPHLYITEYQGSTVLATHGTGSRRLSTDFGTGSSGIWAALNAIQKQNHDWLPIPYPNELFNL